MSGATKEQIEMAERLRVGSAWMLECPFDDGGAIFETFGTWFSEGLRMTEMTEAYDAEQDRVESPYSDTDPEFWAAVLARLK